MAPTFSSVKDFLDRQHRRASLTNVDAEDITNSTTAENGDVVLTVRVQDSEEETVDTSDVAPRDIDRLRARDPFLYYSIQNDRRKRSCCDFEYDWTAPGDADASGGGVPARRGSAFDNFDFGAGIGNGSSFSSDEQSPAVPSASAFRRTSMPNITFSPTANPRQARRHSVMATTNVVKRQRRLSTETHPSLMYESIMAEFSDLDGPDIVLHDVEEEEMIPYLRDD